MKKEEKMAGFVMKKRKGYYSISAVAKMFSVHQQTIRLYEKEGLITPKRSDGNTRMFTEEDVSRLEEVIYLTHQLGINLAGVEMILKLQKQIKKMQRDMNKMFDKTQDDLSKEVQISKQIAENNAKDLLKIKNNNLLKKDNSSKAEEKNEIIPTVDIGNWELEYD